MVFPEFFFSKNAFGPHFPPTSLPCRFCHFCGHFHVFWLFLKVLGLRSRVSSHEMTIFWFQNGSDHQTHHFQQLSCWKQSQNRKNPEITRNHIQFCAQSGRIHGTGVPLSTFRIQGNTLNRLQTLRTLLIFGMLHHGIGNFFFWVTKTAPWTSLARVLEVWKRQKKHSRTSLGSRTAPTANFGGFGECWKRSGVLLSIPYKTGQCLSKYNRFWKCFEKTTTTQLFWKGKQRA